MKIAVPSFLPALLVIFILGGCGAAPPANEPAPARVATVEVGAAPDATLSTQGDRVETRHESAFAGVLPTGFPKDVPVYEPSSLVDFGESGGWSYAVFQTPQDLAVARQRFQELLRARGWAADSAAGFAKQGRHLRLAFENAHPGARIRVEYQR